MSTKPFELTGAEKKEIAAMEDVREMWGAESEQDFLDLFEDMIYAVKFDFVSGGPGYVGDVFILMGDGDFTEHITLYRKDGKIILAEK
jgi:hypothetical protein